MTTDTSIMEQTIQTMEQSQLCLHPTHCHSFQVVRLSLLPWQRCLGCQQRLPTTIALFGGAGASMDNNNNNQQQLVKCVACGGLAHRSCAMVTTNTNDNTTKSGGTHWKTVCPVNGPKLVASRSTTTEKLVDDDDGECVEHPADDSMQFINVTTDSQDTEESFEDADDDTMDENLSSSLTQAHHEQASKTSSDLLKPFDSVTEGNSDSSSIELDVYKQSNNSMDSDPILHYANHPFASVSRALQENITAYFQASSSSSPVTTAPAAPARRACAGYPGQRSVTAMEAAEAVASVQQHNDGNRTATVACSSPYDRAGNDAATPTAYNPLLDTTTTSTSRNRFAELADKVKTTVLSPVGVAGTIAGGVAGFALAGPVGAFAGCQLLGTAVAGGAASAGALGVLVEGSVGLGVFVASVATASLTAQHIQDQIDLMDQRILTMGEDGTSRKLLLIRPNVQIDPVWKQIYSDIRRSAPSNLSLSIPFLPNLSGDATNHDRYRRDSDIIKTDEEEITTNDKVLLLVSRALSDKSSLPGYVYRELLAVFTARCTDRDHYLANNPSILATSPRARRDDAHAVIKYVTATLLEVRPNFGASAAVTELTATAVEGLVFGAVYDLVLDEIKAETAVFDAALAKKISALPLVDSSSSSFVTEDALQALRMLPEAHSAAAKLRYCVDFLEHLSKHFLSVSSDNANLCADSLLKMVCQHIIVANVPNLNAEVVFLEEFARDGQLLRGREGYSLVTLQASLHFMNVSEDLERDILRQDDVEENVAIGFQ
jgi:hypothetical protein